MNTVRRRMIKNGEDACCGIHSDLPGTYYSTYDGRSSFTFESGGTGRFDRQLSHLVGTAEFTYSVNGDKVKCKGVYVSVFDDGTINENNTNWNQTLTYRDGKMYMANGDEYAKR
jgi:hypothetical protein